MARPLRIEFAGGLYHVISRGNARQDIYADDDDRVSFLMVLEKACKRFESSPGETDQIGHGMEME